MEKEFLGNDGTAVSKDKDGTAASGFAAGVRGKCELLVPAGGVNQFIAAVENGADAIYVGGKAFNARINANNFDDEELEKAVEFAHLRGVKVYVTMNTLLTDEELQPALEYAKFLYIINVDALIIQDLGLAKIIKEALPDLPLHLSTQATVYSPAGAEAAKALGFERVVTARELTLEEVRDCVAGKNSIEVFVHGALCFCYSGQCQMSRHMGGRSGNRGQCAQPCRLGYKVLDENGKPIDTFRYPLSPKDLCLIDRLGDYIDAGVASFKIEGRMKSAEYVAIVTSIYRKYIDIYYEKGIYIVSSQDRLALEQIFNRGGFTQGYIDGNPEDELMSGDLPKHRGVKIGKVIKPVKGTALLDVKLYENLSIGDGVEIHNRQLSGNIVTYILPLKSGLTRIGDIKGRFNHGDPIYRISSKEQLKEAQKSFAFSTFDEGKYIRKTPATIELFAEIGKPLTLKISCDLGEPYGIKGASLQDEHIVAEKPIKSPTETELMVKQLSKTGNTPFKIIDVKIRAKEQFSIAVSSLNDLRRQAIELLKKEVLKRRSLPSNIAEITMDVGTVQIQKDNQPKILELCVFDFESFNSMRFSEMDYLIKNLEQNGVFVDIIRLLIPIRDYIENKELVTIAIADRSGYEIIPYVSNMPKGEEDCYITVNFDAILDTLKEVETSIAGSSTKVYVGNIGWIKPFREAGITVLGDAGLNIYNRQAEKAYKTLGMSDCIHSLEDDMTAQGKVPLMVTEHRLNGTYLLDRKGEYLNLINKVDKTIITEDEGIDTQLLVKQLTESKSPVRIYITSPQKGIPASYTNAPEV